ncbi:MAG TPA: endonuclease/exonuclease/phosphatase family protein [Planctomycetota bacterium]
MPLTVRLVSWNVHKCTGGIDRRYDPERIVAVLEAARPDFVLLQEVAQHGRWYHHDRQVDVLGCALGMPHRSYFVNVRFGPRRGEYGNAILSRTPIATTENIDLTLRGRKPRSVLHAELRLPLPAGHTRTLHVFNLHLGLGGRERHEQLQRLLASKNLRALHQHTPVLVAGDFNDVWGTLGPRHLVPAGFRGPARRLRTFPAWAPVRALDSLYVRGDVDLVSIDRPRNQRTRMASDHLPLVAELRVWPT